MDSGAEGSTGPRAGGGRRDFRTPLYERYVSGFKGDRGTGEGSHAWWDHRYLPLLAAVDRQAPLLELGCGDGAFLAYLGQRGFSRARGLDVAPEQIALARARGVDAEVADVFDFLPLARGGYAAIVAVDFVEHFRRAELLRMAPLLSEALRPGGRLLIQTANGAGLLPGQVMYGDLTHMTILTPESISQLLRPVGFESIQCFETGPVPIRLRGKLDVAVWSAVRLVASTVKYVETGKHQHIWTENFICAARRPTP
jgi:SAM-dependent methyltransferase